MKRPQALDDLYRDLRDRKLLPLVGLLLAAIIAVPFALSGSSDPPTSSEPPVADIVPADAPEAQAAVLAENPGLRDYRQRLDALKSKNPFQQQFETSGIEQTTVGTPTQDTGSVAEVTSGSTSTPSTDTASAGSGSTTSTSTTDTTAGGVDVDETDTEPQPQFYSFRLDLQYGVEGDVKQHKNVKVLDILNPVGAFIGVIEDGSRAYFALSSDVTAVSGDGTCVPDPADCEFLALKAGKSQLLTYQAPAAAEPVVYRLALDEIRLVKVKKPQIAP